MANHEDQVQRPNRRRTRLARPDVQLKVVFIAVFVTCASLVVQMRLGVAGLREISASLADGLSSFQVLDIVEAAVVRSLYLSICVALPLAVGIGVLYSFRFAGPLVRFQSYFSGMLGGRWDGRCNLRKGDDLQDVATAVNGAMDEVRDRLCEDREILQEVKHLLTNSVFSTDDSSQHLVDRLIQRVDAAEDAFAVRFPDAAVAPNVARVGEPPAPSGEHPDELVDEQVDERPPAAAGFEA